jgi:DNA-directed RNA polymerase specialized sigma24 family protein
MPAIDATPAPERSEGPPDDVVRAAFRELHGRRLHGFALLLTLGDAAAAARLASEVLATGATRVGELRHPERAAAWLRRRVVDRARVSRQAAIEDRAVLELGADAALLTALGSLDRHERAALIASHVERLDRRDVGWIVRRDGRALDRLLRRARERYLNAYPETAADRPADGPIMARVLDLARRAMT